jgi:hypothetical protein
MAPRANLLSSIPDAGAGALTVFLTLQLPRCYPAVTLRLLIWLIIQHNSMLSHMEHKIADQVVAENGAADAWTGVILGQTTEIGGAV